MDDIDLLIDAYNILQEYIPVKDRQAAADHLVGVICDHSLSDSDIKSLSAIDKYLKRALEDYLGEQLDDDDEDEGYDDSDDDY